MFLLLYKMRQLAIAHHEISIIASTDNLTAVLNRGAFKMLVDAYLQQSMRQPAHNAGAFLVIDADHFKSINDRYGHQEGDVALKLIAQTIQTSLRQGDIVGRIGGEEFGVFLPKANLDQAGIVAGRIRRDINEIEFPPSARTHALSVSVGGAAFGGHTAYDDLFRVADKCLYSAKAGGRNQVIFQRLAA
ncbi:GGDEF domain-containing protein [Hoeflea sp.]|uniref:GGDEF domain-containing protein n=1 Tax=Hoeflea sp. TaxID=1940281 RepID=UPI003A94831A